jgi:hypothetical protein
VLRVLSSIRRRVITTKTPREIKVLRVARMEA